MVIDDCVDILRIYGISHGIIADHGGRLLFESTEGEYTKVTVLLPVYAEDRDDGDSLEQGEQIGSCKERDKHCSETSA